MYTRLVSVFGLLAFGASMLCASAAARASASAPSTKIDRALTVAEIKATRNHDYVAFMKNATPQFKAAITKAAFDSVAAQLTPLLKDGYALSYVSRSKMNGYTITAWKIVPTHGVAINAQLAEKGGKVGGFLLRPA